MKPFFALVALTMFLVSCGSKPKSEGNKYAQIQVDKLTEKDIFTFVKVRAFLEQKKEDNASDNQTFLMGVDAYRNKKNLDSADYYFKKSILESPSNMAYYELGNLYMDRKNYDEAILAYEMAERLGYEPFSKVLYNTACAYSLKNETLLAGQYLEYAIQAGYSNLDNIHADQDLLNLRKDTYVFRSSLNRAMKGITNAENLFWIQFKRQFPKNTTFPLKLDENLDILLLNDETRISYDYERYIAEMRDDKFSREVSKGFYYLNTLQETADYIALVYVVKEEFMGDYAPLTFRVATFTNKGKLIDKKEIAGRSDYEKPLKSAIISKDLSIKISSYETIFEKDPEEEGYYDNKIVKKNKIGEETYMIDKSGKIVLSNIALKNS